MYFSQKKTSKNSLEALSRHFYVSFGLIDFISVTLFLKLFTPTLAIHLQSF